jgi:hypothetical protein
MVERGVPSDRGIRERQAGDRGTRLARVRVRDPGILDGQGRHPEHATVEAIEAHDAGLPPSSASFLSRRATSPSLLLEAPREETHARSVTSA